MAIGKIYVAIQYPDCSPPEAAIKFSSIGDIRRASNQFRINRQNPEAVKILNHYRRFRLNCIRTSLTILRKARIPKRVFISARLKRLTSIYRKFKRNELHNIKSSINEMDDIIGFRIICSSLDEANLLGASLKKTCGARIKNYLQEQHANGIGYRAIHAVLRFNQPFNEKTINSRFEIQIRTWYQHLWACWCESLGERAKEGFPNASDKEKEVKNKLFLVSQKLKHWEEANSNHIQHKLLDISDIYNVAIVWYRDGVILGFDPFMNDTEKAANQLSYLETMTSINPLLLIGVTSQQNLKYLLRNTHPKFMSHNTLDPEYWMPCMF